MKPSKRYALAIISVFLMLVSWPDLINAHTAPGNTINKKPAEIPVDIIDRFIESPFDELNRIRFRYDKNNNGIEVQWIQYQSLFYRLGVRRGDIVTGVNGIKLGTLNSIDEIIHSIIERERFDIEVLRKPPEIQFDENEGKISYEIIRQLVSKPFTSLKGVLLIQVNTPEGLEGLEVYGLSDESILKRMGIQKGDIITSINGISLTNMEDIADSVSSLRFDIEVIRKGTPVTLRYAVIKEISKNIIHLNHSVVREFEVTFEVTSEDNAVVQVM